VNRRDFLKNFLTVAGGGLIFAGVGDYLFVGLDNGTKTGYTGSTRSISTSSENLLPDYRDFLDWLKSASASTPKKSVNISLEAEFVPIAIQQRSLDFLTYSQINDQYSIKPYALQLSDVSLMAQTKSATYDVFGVDNQNLGVFKDSFVSPLELAETYPDLTYPRLNSNEFSPFAWDRVATYPPDLSLGVGGSSPSQVPLYPLDMPLLVTFYRKDIYSQLGMSLPKTWDEYFEDVKTLSTSGQSPYGTVNMAAADISIVYEFATHLASFGAKLWEIDGTNLVPRMNTDAALAALENFVRFKPYSDLGSFLYTWGDVFTSLAHGNAATGLLWHDYINYLNDPLRSAVTDKMGMMTNPAGPNGSFSTFGGAGVGVSRYSKNPQVAWLWLQWATAKGTQETLLLDRYHVYPTRQGVLDVPQVSSELGGNFYLAANLADLIWKSGNVTGLIGFPKWWQALDPLSFHLSQAWIGNETPKQALNAAQLRVEALGTLSF
jgi:multiple sugar transport system substrate-binding protein